MDAKGTQGTNGAGTVGRAPGSTRRTTSKPMATSAKANSVPMFVNSTSSLMFVNHEHNVMNTPVTAARLRNAAARA